MSKASSSLTADELRVLLQRDEGQFVEFKSLWDQSGMTSSVLDRRKVRDLIAESVAAFANADGGTLLLGVEDDGTPSGHGYPDEALDGFFRVPRERLRAAVPSRIGRITLDGHEILVFEVPMSPEAVMVEGNGFPYRTGDQIVREPQEIINARKQAYRQVGFEQRCRPEASLDDLDLDLVAQFFEKSALAGRTAEELLAQFGLVQAKASGWGITNAALLLFGKQPTVRWHPRMGIRFFRVNGTRREHGKHRNVTQGPRIDQPLASLIPETHRLGQEQIGRSEKLHDLFFKETPEYPGFAWQEAIVNAVAHRDYEVQGLGIEVWFYIDRMEVRSPGALVPPASLDALRGRQPVHASRNPLIVRVLAEAGLMRDEGEGIPRIFEEMEESFLRAPAFDVSNDVFGVTLYNEPIFTGPSPEWQALIGRLSITPAQKKCLLAFPEGFTNEDYRRLNQVDRDEAYRQIHELVERGVLRSTGKAGRGASYRVSDDLHRTRKYLEARLPVLRRFFKDHASLKNADYRSLFGLTRYASVRELRRWVEEGLLRLEGERRGARYLPMPPLGVKEE